MSDPLPEGRRLRVLRIFHAGRNPTHRARDRALVETGIDVVYVVPRTWPEPGSESILSAEPFPIIETDVHQPGDINRHCYVNPDAVATVAREHNVDLVDVMEEPFSRVAGQLIPRLSNEVPVVMYSAQNLDKRWPPPFSFYERRSFRRVSAFYPCSRQTASVLRSHRYAAPSSRSLSATRHRLHTWHPEDRRASSDWRWSAGWFWIKGCTTRSKSSPHSQTVA